ADAIRRALTGMVANPQLVVNLNQSLSNSVTGLGEAGSPGRYPLSPNTADLLGVLAISGGSRFPIDDTQLTLTRQGRSLTVPLAAVTRLPDENIRLQPGDQLLLQHRPRRISTFGALGAVTQRDMGPGELTLTDALASVGGLNPTAADARRVLIFRFERPEVADMLGIAQAPTPRGVPVVYRLNLAEPEGFFIANNFVMQPDDVIYAPTTTTAELRKFFEFVQTITRVVYDVQVASTLNVN
ncbi:MAG: polysaccharide biosynthesis/export family protein, partial [Brevundimonas sp.]